jgi:hypothetical protein
MVRHVYGLITFGCTKLAGNPISGLVDVISSSNVPAMPVMRE